jgi:hypothetical protein
MSHGGAISFDDFPCAQQIKARTVAPEGTYRRCGQAGPGSFDLSTMTSKRRSRAAEGEPGVKSFNRSFIP